VIFRAHHLHDDRLFDCYVAERSGETPDPRAADHLADCRDCGARYADIARFMDGLRAEADAETDEAFTADRLRAQQHAIARRLEHVGRPARVISFPGAAGRAMATTASRIAPRWVAAAAAAGLFVGAGLGMSYEWQRTGTGSQLLARAQARGQAARPSAGSSRTLPAEPVATRGSAQADVAADEAFLSDLELALDRPRTLELRAYDALTPHVRDVSDVR
jgi:hypothetical protein